MKPLGLVTGDCEACGDVSTYVRSNFLSGDGGWAGLVEGWRGEMFEMRLGGGGGKWVIVKTSFIEQLQGGTGKNYLYGGGGHIKVRTV